MIHIPILFVGLTVTHLISSGSAQEKKPAQDPNANNGRRFKNDEDAVFWMRNMISLHHFSNQEIAWATGMSKAEITGLKQKLIAQKKMAMTIPSDRLTVVPYPGGRHPRTGFLEGAIRPQRETKISVFLPWDPLSYVVVDVPEAIWSDLGLTYLAHTHIPTVFDRKGQILEKLEWKRQEKGILYLERKLPNGIRFTSKITPGKDHVTMAMTLTNGTPKKRSGLRVQNCVMLKRAKGFAQQTNDNKRFIGPYVVCHNPSKSKWIITAWKPVHRPWANPPCPCLHSDPKFPDCSPGETAKLDGWISFFEGKDIDTEVERIEKTLWWK